MMEIENNMVIDRNWPEETNPWEDADIEQVMDFMFERNYVEKAIREYYYMYDSSNHDEEREFQVIFNDLEKDTQRKIAEKFREQHDMSYEFEDWSKRA